MKCTVKGNIRSHNIQLFNGCGWNSIQLLTGSEDNRCCWRNQLITDLLYFIIFNAFYFNFFFCFLVLLAYCDQLINNFLFRLKSPPFHLQTDRRTWMSPFFFLVNVTQTTGNHVTYACSYFK